MTEQFDKVYVAGDTKPAGFLKVIAPYDDKLLAEVATANTVHIEKALSVAYSLYRNRKTWLPLAKRIEILSNLIALMQEQHDALSMGAAAEGGKPLQDSRVEVTRAIDGIRICIETLRTDAGHVIPMQFNAASANRIAFTQHEPIGVVVAISAFNHPVNLIIHQVAAAVAAGCPVIVKPASNTPLSCLRIVKLLYQAGLPEEWCQALVLQDNSLAGQLASDSRIGFLSFIGSAKVGWMLRSQLAPGARCSLEHGGVAPVIVAEDADVNNAVPLLAKGGFYHAGQVCVSVQRIFVHEKIISDLANKLASYVSKMVVGDPTLLETEIGPLIRHAEVERVDSWVKEAVHAGASLLCGGEVLSASCYSGTVLVDPPVDVRVSTQEVFGPVVCLYRYSDIDSAILRANSLPFSFQGAVFTRDIERMLYVYQNLDASAVMVNDHTAFRVDGMPFAGLRQSGLGVGGIPYTIRDMQIEKMLVIRN
ncbi:MAG: aldehyde dehydrogenase family protein [Legionellales bacterium]|nr:aldehyde dehydrogenase family protein [Legionellales bacterium]